MRHLTLSALVALLAASLLPGTVRAAATIVLWPVDPVIAAGQQSTALWIENRGSEPVTMQVRSLGWHQRDGADDYAAQDAVVSSPPIAQIQPGARQLVRVIRRRSAAEQGETAYRLLIDELPRPASGTPGEASASLAVQMRYSIPLFTYAGQAAPPALSARILFDGRRRTIEIRNAGGQHARLTDIRMVNGAVSTMLVPGLAGYVLAGATWRLALPEGAPVSGRLTIGVNGADQILPQLT